MDIPVAEVAAPVVPVTPSRIALPFSNVNTPAQIISNAVSRIRPEMDLVVANVNRTAEQVGAETNKIVVVTRRVSLSRDVLRG